MMHSLLHYRADHLKKVPALRVKTKQGGVVILNLTRYLRSVHLGFIQYCAKVMQTKFVEIRPLFLRLLYEKSLNFRKMFQSILSEKS